MNPRFMKLLNVGVLIVALLTLIFVILSFINKEWIYLILFIGSLGAEMLLHGIRNTKNLRALFIFTAFFFFCVMLLCIVMVY